jgi:hypothetical protein
VLDTVCPRHKASDTVYGDSIPTRPSNFNHQEKILHTIIDLGINMYRMVTLHIYTICIVMKYSLLKSELYMLLTALIFTQNSAVFVFAHTKVCGKLPYHEVLFYTVPRQFLFKQAR